jgi:hypothetical protein
MHKIHASFTLHNPRADNCVHVEFRGEFVKYPNRVAS